MFLKNQKEEHKTYWRLQRKKMKKLNMKCLFFNYLLFDSFFLSLFLKNDQIIKMSPKK